MEPFAIGLNPFGGAIWHEIALIERRSFLERGEVSFKAPVRGALERHEVHHRGSILAPCQRARFADDQRFEPRPRFPQVMELAPEVRLGLNVCGIRPERPADTLTRNRTAARLEDEKRDELLLTSARDTCDRAAVHSNIESAEHIDTKRGRASHRSRLHANHRQGIEVAIQMLARLTQRIGIFFQSADHQRALER